MLSKEVLRYSGPAAVFVLWGGILQSMRLAGLSFFSSLPLSKLGVSKRSDFIFGATLIISAVLLMLFCLYLNKTFRVGRKFTVVFMIGQVAQIVAALVPYGGASKNIHSVAAFVLAFSLPILIWLFAKTQTGRLRKLANKLFWVELAFFIVGIGTFVLTNKVAPLAQALPAVGFHIWLIALAIYEPSTDS